MAEIPQTRQTLILRLKSTEDAAAWEEFVEIYYPLIHRLATTKGLQAADAQDVAQEVLSKIAKAINQFDPHPESGSFRGWISRITRNMVIDFLRSKKRSDLVTNLASITTLYEATSHDGDSELFDLEHERQMFLWASDKIKSGFKPKDLDCILENNRGKRIDRENRRAIEYVERCHLHCQKSCDGEAQGYDRSDSI